MRIQIHRTQLPQLVMASAVLLALLSAWNIARMAMLVAGAGRGQARYVGPAVAPTSHPSSMDRILESGLFGRSDASAPRTSLPYTLKGTYAGPHGQGFAIIADSHGKSGVYAKDGHLPGNVRISAIEAHRVLLDTPDGVESLPLHEPAGAPSFRDQSVAQPGSGQASPGVRAVSGVRITQRFPPSLLHALDLRPGDTLVGVNGKPLADRAEILAQLHTIQPGVPLHISVIRDGQPITLDVRPPAPGMLDRLKP